MNTSCALLSTFTFRQQGEPLNQTIYNIYIITRQEEESV